MISKGPCSQCDLSVNENDAKHEIRQYANSYIDVFSVPEQYKSLHYVFRSGTELGTLSANGYLCMHHRALSADHLHYEHLAFQLILSFNGNSVLLGQCRRRGCMAARLLLMESHAYSAHGPAIHPTCVAQETNAIGIRLNVMMGWGRRLPL
jgi:hypothetical protein